jgi:PAS domain S-box-containing protein
MTATREESQKKRLMALLGSSPMQRMAWGVVLGILLPVLWINFSHYVLDVFGPRGGLLTLVAIIALCALVGGLWGGLTATVSGGVVGFSVLGNPEVFGQDEVRINLTALTLFVAIGLFMSVVVQEFHSRYRDLQRSKERVSTTKQVLEDVMNAVSDAYIAVDRNWNIALSNESADELYSEDGETLVGKNLWAALPADLRIHIAPRIQKAMAFQHADEQTIGFDGRWIQVRMFPTSGGLLMNMLDVTQMKENEETIAYANKKHKDALRMLQHMLSNSPLGYMFFDTDLQLTQLNANSLKMLGLENPGLQTAQYLFGDHWNDVEHHFRAMLNMEKEVSRIEIRCKDRWLTIGLFLIEAEGAEPQIGLILMDVTELVESVERERLADHRFRSLVEAASSLVWRCNAEGEFISHNSAWEQYTGQGPKQQANRGWRNAVHEQDLSRLDGAGAKALDKGSTYVFEGRLWHEASQGYRQIRSQAVPLLDDEGNVLEWIGMVEDIHDEHTLKVQLREVFEREREARYRAEELSRLKDEFLSNVSHELRTPLTSVIGFSELLLNKDLDQESRRMAKEAMNRSAHHLNTLVDRMFEFQKVVHGKLSLEYGQFRLDELVADCIVDMQPELDKKNLSVRQQLDAVPMEADDTRVRQVVLNLVSNAIKFSHPQGVIQVRVFRTRDLAVLEVQDQGMGIEPKYKDMIFERLLQGPTSAQRSGTGLGLGLAISRELVNLHNGTISVESPGVGEGATFRVELPVRRSRPVLPASASPESSKDSKGDRPQLGHQRP